MDNTLHDKLDSLLDAGTDNEGALGELMEIVGMALDSDRCCLFLRHPVSRLTLMTHEWDRSPEFALRREGTAWTPESPTLEADDPMFAEALANPEALYIEDVRSAGANLVNAEYEETHFGHRALVHAPLYHEGRMYGILEPCVFANPRVWTHADKALVARVQGPMAGMAAAYVGRHCPSD